MTNSELVKRNIIEHYDVRPENIVVIYNGVDTLRFNPRIKEKYRKTLRERYSINKEELVLLFVSNNFKLKSIFSRHIFVTVYGCWFAVNSFMF